MDIKTLPTILGHVSSATTLNTYSHITDEMRQRAAVKIDQGIAKAGDAEQEEKPKERTMTTFQARKWWSRKVSLMTQTGTPKSRSGKCAVKNDCFRDNKQFSKGIVR